MVRSTAREIAVHLSYELSFAGVPVEEVLERHLSAENFASLAGEDEVYQETPKGKQREYITRLVTGVDRHAFELDSYIEKYAKGWRFARMPLVATAIMRVAMYEMLYMEDIPTGVAITEAVELFKKYERDEVVKFVNGLLGTFAKEEMKPT